MLDDHVPNDVNFADFAKRQGSLPNFRPLHGAQAIEILNLIQATEALGDSVLRYARTGQMDRETANDMLGRLLKCYSEPLANSREIARVKIEARSWNRCGH